MLDDFASVVDDQSATSMACGRPSSPRPEGGEPHARRENATITTTTSTITITIAIAITITDNTNNNNNSKNNVICSHFGSKRQLPRLAFEHVGFPTLISARAR